MNILQRLALIFVILSSSNFAIAISCGDDISSNITLTSDLHCTTGYTALNVVSDNVAINLNGHTISGVASLAGITIFGANNVSVYGGSIIDFFAGINVSSASKIEVRKITFFKTAHGIIFHQVNDSQVTDSDFIMTSSTAVRIYNTQVGETSRNNRVAGNEFYKTATGIQLCGAGTIENELEDNLIWKSSNYAIELVNSAKNQIINNRLLENLSTGIRLNYSSDNHFKSNYLNGGNNGITILADGETGICESTNATISARNKFVGTSIFEFDQGVVFGLGSKSEPKVYYNSIVYGKIYDNNIGVLFNKDAWANDLSSASITRNSSNVIDNGTSNTY